MGQEGKSEGKEPQVNPHLERGVCWDELLAPPDRMSWPLRTLSGEGF